MEQNPQPCIFCKIVSGEAPSYKVYEDDSVLAFLDISPVNRGHTLIIPKQHFQDIHDINESMMTDIYKVVKKVAEAQKKVLRPEGIQVAQNNGRAAGQVIFHFHAHSIPKNQDHGHHERLQLTPEELEEVAKSLRDALGNSSSNSNSNEIPDEQKPPW